MTTTTYKVAINYDNAIGLADLSPQPFCELGMQVAEVRYAADGSVSQHGNQFADIEYVNLKPAQYTALLAKFGLGTTFADISQECTVTLPVAGRASFSTYNALVVHRQDQDASFEDHLIQRAVFHYTLVEALS